MTKSLLFSSNLKRLQSKVSQHVGDTSRGAVFVILVDEASCTYLDVLYLVFVILLVAVPDYSTVFQGRADKGVEGCFPTVRWAKLKVFAQET